MTKLSEGNVAGLPLASLAGRLGSPDREQMLLAANENLASDIAAEA